MTRKFVLVEVEEDGSFCGSCPYLYPFGESGERDSSECLLYGPLARKEGQFVRDSQCVESVAVVEDILITLEVSLRAQQQLKRLGDAAHINWALVDGEALIQKYIHYLEKPDVQSKCLHVFVPHTSVQNGHVCAKCKKVWTP